MFDFLDFQNWKVKMTLYLKALCIHIYLATIKESYFINGKYLQANAKAIHALKLTLKDDHLLRVSKIDSAFALWNTLTSLDEQMQNDKKRYSDQGSDTSDMCYMVQGVTPLR